MCESIVIKVKLFIIYYGGRRKIKNYADFNNKIIHDLEEEESRITNHGNWLILIIKLSMSLTKIYNFRVFVSSFSSGQSTQMTKQRLVSSKFEEDWLARGSCCHVPYVRTLKDAAAFRFARWFVSEQEKKKKKRRKGWHLAGTCYAHSSPLPASSHLPPVTRNFPASYSIVPFQNLFIIL